jgi:ABC-type branched-subunit amino acid transport system permease subunit
VGYCGQISLGTGGFMAVGAYAAYNFFARIDGMPLIPALLDIQTHLDLAGHRRVASGRK